MNADDYDEDALLTARNKLHVLYLAINRLVETAPEPAKGILSIERVFDEALCDLDRGLKLAPEAA
jgi:hypothetical protein